MVTSMYLQRAQLKAAITLSPKSAEAYQQLAQVLMSLGMLAVPDSYLNWHAAVGALLDGCIACDLQLHN